MGSSANSPGHLRTARVVNCRRDRDPAAANCLGSTLGLASPDEHPVGIGPPALDRGQLGHSAITVTVILAGELDERRAQHALIVSPLTGLRWSNAFARPVRTLLRY